MSTQQQIWAEEQKELLRSLSRTALISDLQEKIQALRDENEGLRDQIDSLEEELEAKEIEILDLHREFIEEGI